MKIPNKRELQPIAFNHSSVLQNYILFWLLILFLHEISFYISERIFEKEYKVNHDNW